MDFGTYAYRSDVAGRPLWIFGAGELGRLAASYFTLDSPYDVAGFIVDDEFPPVEGAAHGYHIMTYSEMLRTVTPGSADLFVALSAKRLSERRLEVMADLRSRGYALSRYVSSRAFIAPDAHLGDNVFVFEMNCIQSQVVIEDGVVLWSGNHVGHQTRIGRGTFLTSHVVVAGATTIGERCYLGINCAIRDQISVGAMTVVGANSYVSRDTLGGQVLFGSPARAVTGLDPLEAIK